MIADVEVVSMNDINSKIQGLKVVLRLRVWFHLRLYTHGCLQEGVGCQ